MYLKHSDLFSGMNMDLIRWIMEIGVRESYEQGQILFNGGDYPDRFYLLIRGSIQLKLEETGEQVYLGNTPGELIGWSALVDRNFFTTSAECLENTDVLKIDRERFLQFLNQDPGVASLFYKNLSRALGHRLMQVYDTITHPEE